MKYKSNDIANLSLIMAAVMGGSVPTVMKFVLRELPPLTTSFLRVALLCIALLPVLVKNRNKVLIHFNLARPVGLTWAANITFFVIGIPHTTAFVSQLLYASVPIFMLGVNRLSLKENITTKQRFGSFLGALGVISIISSGANLTPGGLYGGALVLTAAFLWTLYLIFLKRLAPHLSVFEATASSAALSTPLVFAAMYISEGFSGLVLLPVISIGTWIALIILSLVTTLGYMIFFQIGVKHGSAFLASNMIFISILVSLLESRLLLGEPITVSIILGAAILLCGVYYAKGQPDIKTANVPAPSS